MPQKSLRTRGPRRCSPCYRSGHIQRKDRNRDMTQGNSKATICQALRRRMGRTKKTKSWPILALKEKNVPPFPPKEKKNGWAKRTDEEGKKKKLKQKRLKTKSVGACVIRGLREQCRSEKSHWKYLNEHATFSKRPTMNNPPNKKKGKSLLGRKEI